MNLIITILLFACVALQIYSSDQKLTFHQWNAWKSKHGKKYGTTEEELRHQVKWEQNFRNVQKHNIRFDHGLETYTIGLNQFSDLDEEEFRQLRLSRGIKLNGQQLSSRSSATTLPRQSVPTSIDWRQFGLVTPVKDQGDCGSCWAFSATGAVEGQYAKKTGHLISFSEQQLVECSLEYGNHGCDGGLMENAFEYLEKYGLEKEIDYPYTAHDTRCVQDAGRMITKVTGYLTEHAKNETQLLQMAAQLGPIAVAIDAKYIMQYKGGVFRSDSCSSTELNHGVLLVGYGVESGQDYWLVKNSWSEAWGDHGFIKIARGQNNMCGIATLASVPIL